MKIIEKERRIMGRYSRRGRVRTVNPMSKAPLAQLQPYPVDAEIAEMD